MKGKYFYWCCFFAVLLPVIPVKIPAQEKPPVLEINGTRDVHRLIAKATEQRVNSNADQALHLAQEALQLAIATQNKAAIAEAMVIIALCYKDKGEYLRSKQLLYLAQPYCITAAPYTEGIMAYWYSQLGTLYGLLGDNDSSIYFFYEALAFIKNGSTRDSLFKVSLLSNIGTSWMQKEDLNKALYYHKKAELLAKQLGDTMTLATLYSNIGTVYHLRKDSVHAMHYFEASLKLYQQKKAKKIYSLQFLYYSMGTVQPTLADAMPYYNRALAMDSHSVNAASIYELIGQAYFDSGIYDNAEKYYKSAEELSKRKGLDGHLLAVYSKLAAVYENMNLYKPAYQYQTKFVRLNDSLRTIDKDRVINQLDVKYRTAEKDKMLAENKAQLYKQQRWIIASTGSILLLTLVSFGVYRNYRYKQRAQEDRLQSLEQQEKIGKLQAKTQGEEEERSRIARELHDGINVLLSATKMNYASLGKEYKGLTEAPSYGVIMGLLNEMGFELRTIMYKLVPELLIQQSLPDAVETFCDLIRRSKKLHIEFQFWGSFSALPAEYCFAVYRVVQESVHNIIKHANATSVLIQLRHQDGMLCLSIDDNGDGFNEKKATTGMGLQSMRSRIESLGGQVVFSSKANEGTSVEVELAIQSPAVNNATRNI